MTYTEAHHQGVTIRFHFESLSAVSVLNIMCSSPTLLFIILTKEDNHFVLCLRFVCIMVSVYYIITTLQEMYLQKSVSF